MSLQQTAQKLESIAMTVRDELQRIGEHHSCIFAGAVLAEVLRRKGYAGAYPLTVRVIIFNPVIAPRIKESGVPTDPKILAKMEEEGGRRVFVGTGSEPGPSEWAGHLVVVLPKFFGDYHAICDITITQANKTGWGIDLVPMCLRVPDTFVNGRTEFKATVNGSLVVYMAFPDDESYNTTAHWTNSARRDHVTELALAAVE